MSNRADDACPPRRFADDVAMAPMSDALDKLLRRTLPHDAVFGEVDYEPGGAFGPRVQQDVQLVVIHRGSAAITIDGRAHRLAADHVCCLAPGATEYFRFDRVKPTHHSWVALHFDPVPRGLKAVLRKLPFDQPMTRRMGDVLELGLSVMRRRLSGDHAVLLHLGVAFWHAYVAAAEMDKPDRPVPEPVARARRYMDRHFAEPMELADVARAAGVTQNHLVRLFAKHIGHTPMRYLWRVRVQRGADLLRDTGLNVSQIAYRAGFSTPYHFSRLVKQQLGVSPSELRQSHWQPRGV